MNKLLLTAIVSTGLLLAGPGLAQEEEAAEPNLADVWYLAPKKGHSDEFEAAIVKHLKVRAEAGEARTWQVYQPVIGTKLGYYAIRSCCFDWPDFDAHDEWSRANAAVNSDFQKKVGEHLDHYHHYIGEMDPENSHWPAMEEGPWPFYGVTRWTPKQGATGVDDLKKMFSQLAKAGELDSHWLWEWRIGGTDELSVVTPFRNYADMAELEKPLGAIIAEHLGSSGAATKMFGEFGEKFDESTYTVYRFRADLSSAMETEEAEEEE